MRRLSISGFVSVVLLASVAQAQLRTSNSAPFPGGSVTPKPALKRPTTGRVPHASPTLTRPAVQGRMRPSPMASQFRGHAPSPTAGPQSLRRPPVTIGPKLPVPTFGNPKGGQPPKAPLMTFHSLPKVQPPKHPLPTLGGIKGGHPPKSPLTTVHSVTKVQPPKAPLTTFHSVKYVHPPKAPLPAPAKAPAPPELMNYEPRDPGGLPGGLRAKLALDVARDEQNKELSEILGGLETIAISLASPLFGPPLDQIQDALDAAKNGDFTALDKLINDATIPEMKNVLEAYQITAQCLTDLQKDGLLDDQTLNRLENALKTLPPNAITDSFRNTLDDVKKWNEIGKKLDSVAQNPGSQGQGGDPGNQGWKGPATAAEILSVVNQALATAGNGGVYGVLPAYGDADGYGVAAGSYAEPPVPAAPVPAAPVAAASIILSNPAENSVTMPFLLNSQTTELPAGQRFELPTDRAWEIKFDRGEGFGVASYSLTDGLYQFTHTRQGWELVQGEPAAK